MTIGSTVKMDINTGLEYSPSDGLTGQVKLHNFTVGHDGSLYKLPALRNIGHEPQTPIITDGGNKTFLIETKIWDLKKRGAAPYYTDRTPAGSDLPKWTICNCEALRSFYLLSDKSISCFLLNQEKRNIDIQELADHYPPASGDINKLNKFFTPFFFDLETTDTMPFPPSDLTCGWREVVPIPYALTLDDGTGRIPVVAFTHRNTATKGKQTSINGFLANNATYALIDKNNGTPYLQSFQQENGTFFSGPIILGGRMFYYFWDGANNAIICSENNKLNTLQKVDTNPTADLYKIVVAAYVYGIKEFNGDMLVFTDSGIERWVLNSNAGDADKRILLRDSSFKYHYKLRWDGQAVNANKELYFHTEDYSLYVLRSSLTVDPIFEGKPPLYNPLKQWYQNSIHLSIESKMAYFKMLGYWFVTMGPYLYNITTKTFSTYGYDGWQYPQEDFDPATQENIWANDVEKRMIHASCDDIVCTYSCVCAPMSYLEMSQQITDETKNSLIKGGYQWGQIAMFCSRIYQDTKCLSVDGVMIYVRGGTLKRGDKVWLKVLLGEDAGEIDEFADVTWGVPLEYQPLENGLLGYSNDTTGIFIWRGNVKTNRFRVQVVTDCRRPMIIEAVLCNISMQVGAGTEKLPQQAQ